MCIEQNLSTSVIANGYRVGNPLANSVTFVHFDATQWSPNANVLSVLMLDLNLGRLTNQVNKFLRKTAEMRDGGVDFRLRGRQRLSQEFIRQVNRA